MILAGGQEVAAVGVAQGGIDGLVVVLGGDQPQLGILFTALVADTHVVGGTQGQVEREGVGQGGAVGGIAVLAGGLFGVTAVELVAGIDLEAVEQAGVFQHRAGTVGGEGICLGAEGVVAVAVGEGDVGPVGQQTGGALLATEGDIAQSAPTPAKARRVRMLSEFSLTVFSLSLT